MRQVIIHNESNSPYEFLLCRLALPYAFTSSLKCLRNAGGKPSCAHPFHIAPTLTRTVMQIRRMFKSGRHLLAAAAFLSAGAALWAQSVPANQITSEDHSDTAGGSTAVKVPPSTEAILKELDAMRARIAELEAQLKAQSAVNDNVMAVDAATQLQASRQTLLASGAPAATTALSSPSIASVPA